MIHIPRIPGAFLGHNGWSSPKVSWLVLYVGLSLLALAVGAEIVLAVSKSQGADVDSAGIEARVFSFAETWQPQVDPLVKVGEGVEAKRSNVEGVKVGGVRYHYMMPNAPSYDPVSIGVTKEYQVVSVVHPRTHWEVVIYRLQD